MDANRQAAISELRSLMLRYRVNKYKSTIITNLWKSYQQYMTHQPLEVDMEEEVDSSLEAMSHRSTRDITRVTSQYRRAAQLDSRIIGSFELAYHAHSDLAS